MGDFEAWMELASLYLQENQFVGAQFCFEELILSNPYNNVFHQRYAEILFTIGGSDNLELAQKHFAQAVKLNPKSVRSLDRVGGWTVLLCFGCSIAAHVL